MHANFNDREAHTHWPISIARFREAATKTIYEQAKQVHRCQDVAVDDNWLAEKTVDGTPDTMANHVRLITTMWTR